MPGDKEEVVTAASEDCLRPLTDKRLDDRGSYNFTLSKEGCIPKTVTYNTVFDKEGQYDVYSSLDLGMDPLVEDLADLIEIRIRRVTLIEWM